MQDNLVFLHEDVALNLVKYLRRKFGKKIRSDAKSLMLFYKTLRYTLNFYKNINDKSATIGIEFVFAKSDDDNSALIKILLVLNNGTLIEIKNSNLGEAVAQMFGQKLFKEKRLFFHWSKIEEFEQKLAATEEK